MYCSNYIELDFIEDLKFRILVVLHSYIYIYFACLSKRLNRSGKILCGTSHDPVEDLCMINDHN